MERKNAGIIISMLVFASLFTILAMPTEAASKSQKKAIAQTPDFFLRQATLYANSRSVQNNTSFKKELKKIIEGDLTSKQKAVIAASATGGYKWKSHDYMEIGTVSVKQVRKTYKNIFGSTSSIHLPSISYATDYGHYYYDHALSHGKVYGLSYEDEANFKSSIVSIKGNTVTKKIKLFTHWSHTKPDRTATVIIKLKGNKSSKYKCVIRKIYVK